MGAFVFYPGFILTFAHSFVLSMFYFHFQFRSIRCVCFDDNNYCYYCMRMRTHFDSIIIIWKPPISRVISFHFLFCEMCIDIRFEDYWENVSLFILRWFWSVPIVVMISYSFRGVYKKGVSSSFVGIELASFFLAICCWLNLDFRPKWSESD